MSFLRDYRVNDAEADPLGVYLTILDWFERWESIRFWRYKRWNRRTIPEYALDRYRNRELELLNLREEAFIEGCRLGASPIEMGQLLDRTEDIPWMISKWDRLGMSQAEMVRLLDSTVDPVRMLYAWDSGPLQPVEQAQAAYSILGEKYEQMVQPLRDLRTWQAASEGRADASKSPVSLSRALRKLFDYIHLRSGIKIEALRDAMHYTDNSHTYTSISRLRRAVRQHFDIRTENGEVFCEQKNNRKITDR
jgi:hypothetical protein